MAESPLSVHLRLGTQALHRQAEGTLFVQELLAGRLDTAAYARMLRNLLPLYQALERGLRAQAEQPALQPIVLPELFRAEALEADLQVLHGPGWASSLPLVSAAETYARQLDALAADDPPLLAAHAYVRYLGDLFGGQLFARLVAKMPTAAGSPPPQALRFHDFGPPARVAQLVRAFRTGLDALPADEALARRIVAEALQGFERHVALFGELATACGLAGAAPLRTGR